MLAHPSFPCETEVRGATLNFSELTHQSIPRWMVFRIDGTADVKIVKREWNYGTLLDR